MSPLKLCSLEVNASLLTTVQRLALAMWPHLTPGWAMCWHELDVSVCLSPLSFLAPTQPCPAFPPPSLWLSVYTDCLLGVRGKSPRLLFQCQHLWRAVTGPEPPGMTDATVRLLSAHTSLPQRDWRREHFPADSVQANLWDSVWFPGSLTCGPPSTSPSPECLLKMQMTGLYPQPPELISRSGGWESALLNITPENYFAH